MGHEVKECHISLWGDKIDKTRTFVGVASKIQFVLRLMSIYPRLFIKYLFIGHHDIIFVGYFGHLDIFFIKLFSIFNKKKIVFDTFLSLYDTMVCDREMLKVGSFSARVVYSLDKYSCKLADVVILDTYAHIDYFNNTFGTPREKMARIFAGADTEIFSPGVQRKQNGKFNVLFMGKYTPLHGIEFIVKAAEIMKDDTGIQFTFIGKGQLYQKIRGMVVDAQLDNIHFIEWVKYEELPQYIANTDVCLGIFSDSLKASRVIPNKVFQYMAMGKAIITARTPGIVEGLKNGENALLCNPADPQDLSRAIIRLKEDGSLMNKIASSARETFLDVSGDNAIIHELECVLERIH
ncbi:glycosyl transferase group 1 [Candidatus Scalindua japonica]|uniref:Glycosyl transferase group 1 n=2 Tax=Candidatus Scalindua japonica TaxID=1284222 RepID=A0A286U4D6_9BACT|nr:glycosyl transferase group 1 [Candidatus Scalindua japonica]